MITKAIFLDRDGVINQVVMRDGKPGSPRTSAEFEFELGVEDELQRLRAAGFKLFVATNQPDIARGLLSIQALETMTQRVVAKCRPDGIKICPHDDRDRCECRKPKPGMLTELAREHGIDLAQAYLIGDSRKDVMAAKAAGSRAIILDRAYNHGEPADWRVTDLKRAVDLILRETAK
ncbi:MAG TPA: HAD-IIIA family hydrolase [Candidatus Binataceae bacterium]|nr:HAD-IIIA family hydrolase [Candidatus Binataceae bacterium]